MTKRLFDIFFAFIAIIVLIIPSLLIIIFIKLTSTGPAIYWSKRLGRYGNSFFMPKFRTMKTNTPEVPTEQLYNPSEYITPIGLFLRKYSLDEFPQFISVLKGDMSLVGPRPSLHNQRNLIRDRKKYGIYKLKPGITGWAQINGRDKITLKNKVELDYEYSKRQSISFDFYIIIKSFIYVIKSSDIEH